ncbi:NusG domain II-containing protein [Clostridium thermopalmarium]|uniref:Uncharacterized protein n=1 Tax=Clostridium thermopalmarium DSM 5974 TaxID=1121340 RepID=A0A2T0AZJ3_9CLOT|nr:NusG domain II-containing protein [Clostridium thermopalmarium]PRR76629.1 hypothetical protein CPAL_03000 [Clostridium thermopalmarium DSM 5974]PVZ28258.1 hypothetical protein LX19_00229 [Clostridium thermopalmarium DSM 5974]
MMKKLELKKLELKKLDIIIIVVLLILSIIPSIYLMLFKSDNENSNIVIKVDGELTKSVPLKNENKSNIYEFNFDNNIGYVEVKNGRVRMLEMDKEVCPEGICSDTGWIENSYESIVCLPNRIIVTIEGNKDEVIDAQTS